MQRTIVDTHVHTWDLERARYDWLSGDTSILNRTYHVTELHPHLSAAKVTHGVLVQAANNFEDTDVMLETATLNDWVAGVVGWLPLIDPAATEAALLQKYLRHRLFKGVRHLIHNETNSQWLLQDRVLESLRMLAHYQLPYDVVGINTTHLETAIRVSEKVPSLRIVLDHLNQPPIAGREKFGRWGALMKEAAQHPAIYCKISGLGTTTGNFGGWTAEDIKPYILYVLELFGTDRCFCGGDWPVSLLAGTYEKTWIAYQEVLEAETSPAEQQKILSANAESFYQLELN